MFLVIVELVRRRKLKEEYAWLWILSTLGMVGLALFYPLLEWVTAAIGAVTATSTLFIFGLLFLLLISVHYSTVLSQLTQQVRRRLAHGGSVERTEHPPHQSGLE